MNAPLADNLRFDIQGLSQAIADCTASDGLQRQFSPSSWDALAAYLQPFSLKTGQVLTEQGAHDRILYFIESGTLSVHHEDENAHVRMAMVGSGSLVGEGGFFSHQPRTATVQASSPCKLWCLTPPALCRAGQPSQLCGAGVDHGHGCGHGQAAVQPLQTGRGHLRAAQRRHARHVCVLCTSHGQNMPFLHAQNFPKRAWLGKIMWLINTTVLYAEIVYTCGIAAASTLTTTKNVNF